MPTGDGVGDDCDPNFGIGRDRIALFVTMQPGDMPFASGPGTGGATWTQGPDGLLLDGPLAGDFYDGLSMPLTAGDQQLSIGIDITAVGNPTTQHQFAVGTITPVPNYFGEMNELLGSYSNVQITRFDGTLYNQVQAQGLPSGIHSGRVKFTLTQKLNTTTRVDVSWPGEPYSAEFSDALYQGADSVQININNLQLQIVYVCVITSA